MSSKNITNAVDSNDIETNNNMIDSTKDDENILDTVKKLNIDFIYMDSVPNDVNKTIMTLPDGDTYEGSIKDGKFFGYGKYTSKCGKIIYEGDIKNSLKHGKGKLIHCDKVVYEGEWKNNKKNGYGKLIEEGIEYNGLFDKDVFIKGSITAVNGDIYEGEFDGKYHGKGKLIRQYDNMDTIYNGSFEHGLYHGFGELRIHHKNPYSFNRLLSFWKKGFPIGNPIDC